MLKTLTKFLTLLSATMFVACSGSSERNNNNESDGQSSGLKLSNPSELYFDEGSTINYMLNAEGTSPISFSIAGGEDANEFNIDASTGELSSNQSLDFENPADANQDNIYELLISVSDGSNSNTVPLSVSIKDVDNSSAKLLFPSANAELGGEQSIEMMGKVLASEDGQSLGQVRVNGFPARFLVEHPDTWVVEVPLEIGSNNVVIEYQSTRRETFSREITISNNNILSGANQFYFDEQNNVVYLINEFKQSVIEYDLDTNSTATVASTVESAEFYEALFPHFYANKLTFYDNRQKSIYMADLDQQLIKIVYSLPDQFNGAEVFDMSIDKDNNHAILTFSNDTRDIIKIDLNSRSHSLLPAPSEGWFHNISTVFDNESGTLLINVAGSAEAAGLYSVDIDTLERVKVSDYRFNFYDRMVKYSEGKILLSDLNAFAIFDIGSDSLEYLTPRLESEFVTIQSGLSIYKAIFREYGSDRIQVVDLQDQQQWEDLSSGKNTGLTILNLVPSVALGNPLHNLTDISFSASKNSLLSSNINGKIFSINLLDGQRTSLSAEVEAEGDGIAILGADYNKITNDYYLFDFFTSDNSSMIYKSNLATGKAIPVLSRNNFQAFLEEQAFLIISSAELDLDKNRIYFTTNTYLDSDYKLYSYDLTTNKVFLVKETRAIDKTPEPYSLSNVDKENNLIFTGGLNYGQISSIGIESGEETLILPNNTGLPSNFSQITSLWKDPREDRLLITDASLRKMYWLDLNSLSTKIITGDNVGKGISISSFDDTLVDIENHRAFFTCNNGLCMVNLLNGDRAIISN